MGVKEYKLPNGKTAVFEYDEYGIGKITIEAMDRMMELINIDLVRCGECKWFINEGSVTICDMHEQYIEPTDFCSYGERRADETQP